MRDNQISCRTLTKNGLLFLMLFALVSCAHPNISSLSTEYRVLPYVQNPTAMGVTLKWFSHNKGKASVHVYDEQKALVSRWQSSAKLASELVYSEFELLSNSERENSVPYNHEVRINGLEVGRRYVYEVNQNGELARGEFKTAVSNTTPIRLIVYADSETEPESTGKHTNWPSPTTPDEKRPYLIDQTTGYRENLKAIAEREPDFIAIAGDLVESGGEQRDWDEFWRQNQSLAANVPIMPALGNHEYYAGPEEFGAWEVAASERSIAKFKSYFDLPENDARNTQHNERYYSFEYGPLTLITLDLGNGEKNKTPEDTNWSLLADGEGGVTPSWSPGSEQYKWLEIELKAARQKSQFTFVMFHHCPYTSGVHGLKPGVDGGTSNNTSGSPLRALTPLFMEYGVDVLLNGHDEMAEHSVVSGKTVSLKSNDVVAHDLHVFDVGIGGDGLRGPHPSVENAHQVFIAHDDSPEVYSESGVLVDGGKHYGHLEINIFKDSLQEWTAELDIAYIFPVMNSEGIVTSFERRLYPDKTKIVSKRKIP